MVVAFFCVGNHMYFATPVQVVHVDTDEMVHFKVYNNITKSTMDWITTAFVSPSGVEVCDKVENVAFEDFSEHVYKAKCHDGFAYADVFAYSDSFSSEQASADTTLLPDECKNAFDGQVVRYTFVFSCNCEKIPDIPSEIVGGVPESRRICRGSTAAVTGDPHFRTFDSRNGVKFDCMGAGEFVMSKATLDGYDYDFEIRGRFWKYELENFEGTWNTGVSIKQDVTVQLTISESVLPYSSMFAEMPVNFYVDGERAITQGSGDHRVIVSVDGFNVDLFFTTTGISVSVLVRPASQWGHAEDIPGNFNTFVCFPNDNDSITHVTGLLGSPDGDFSNDWMTTDGTPMDPDSMDDYEYCIDNWCIRDEADTFFTFDEGYDFAHYDRCDDPISRRRLTTIDLTTAKDKIKQVCSQVDNDPACLFDGILAGLPAAEQSVESIREDKKRQLQGRMAQDQDSTACCSRDFRSCDPSCGTNKYTCEKCDPGDTFIWLAHGELEVECDAKGTACTDDGCCAGLECNDSGVCVPKDIASSRRLEEFVFVRPDLPFERNIIAYSGGF